MKKAILFISLCFSVFSYAEDKIHDQVVRVPDENTAMSAAISRAQAELDEFFEIQKAPPAGADGFKLKVMVEDENGIEHLWFSPFKPLNGAFVGVLVNEPNLIKSMDYGKVYSFQRSQISDWGYVQNGKQVGSYTVCVLFNTLDKQVAEQYKKDHGFVCED